jgi:hypothetical protein
VILLITLVHGHWFAAELSKEWLACPCQNWWVDVEASPPRFHTLLGGMLRSCHALVDASTVALQLVDGADDGC